MLIGEAEPFARGRKRFIVGPSFANASDTTKLALSKPKLFSALATAEFKTFKMISAALFGVNVKIAIASATLLPRMLSRTRRDLRGETRTVRAIALAEVISAIYVLLIFYVFSCRLQRDLCKYELVQIHQVCDLPCLLGCKQVRVYVRHKLQ
ncbi:hypothetical protein D8834_05120 [Streptococcus oralis]|nr:hypothetical protein D8834_05120 [Streptococcus oralis]